MLTQLFQPEPNLLKGIEFAKGMTNLGHSVQVLTSFPNYPLGKIYPGYRRSLYSYDLIDDISIVRVPHYIDHSGSGFKRALSYISFAMAACIPGIFLIKKPDIVHVYQGPATLVFSALFIKFFLRVPYVLDVQDIWPQSVVGSGMLKYKFIVPLLSYWSDLTYRFATKIIVLSPGYKNEILKRGVPENKIDVVFNWCDSKQERDIVRHDSATSLPIDGFFNVVYAGNFGKVQALESLLGAANLLKHELPRLRVTLVGDGVEKKRLEALVKEGGIGNVFFMPRQSTVEINSILTKADALVIHLRADPLSSIGIPQKTQAYLASGRPIIMATGLGDAADMVKIAKAGIFCDQESEIGIAEAICTLFNMPLEEREQMGVNGREFYENNLSYLLGVKKMENILLKAC